MDSSFTIKPSPGVAKGRALRDPVPVREAADTELVGAKTVAATAERGNKDDDAKQGDPRQPEQRPDRTLNNVEVDPDGRDVIYRERDVRATEREHPDQALLRQRAYHRLTPTEAEIPPPDDPHADIKA
jgi:hypothetical protein